MSLNIKDAVYGLGEKLGVDMTNAPASNIADMIDYISNGVGAHTGVIAEAVDKLEISGGGSADWFFGIEEIVDPEDSDYYILNKTWNEIKTVYGDGDGTGDSKLCGIRVYDGEENEYFLCMLSSVAYVEQSGYYVERSFDHKRYTTNDPNGYPRLNTEGSAPEVG